MFGARGILQEAKGEDGETLSIASLRAAVDAGNRTAVALERKMLSINDLSVAEANNVFTYILFRNSICDLSLLSGPDSEYGVICEDVCTGRGMQGGGGKGGGRQRGEDRRDAMGK